MFRVAYRCVLRSDVGSAEIDALMASRAEMYASVGVTSAALFSKRRLLHALEGPSREVRAILEQIWDDRRNEEFAVMDIAHGEALLFPDWSLKLITEDTLALEPELKFHSGIDWLGNLGGGLDHFFFGPISIASQN